MILAGVGVFIVVLLLLEAGFACGFSIARSELERERLNGTRAPSLHDSINGAGTAQVEGASRERRSDSAVVTAVSNAVESTLRNVLPLLLPKRETSNSGALMLPDDTRVQTEPPLLPTTGSASARVGAQERLTLMLYRNVGGTESFTEVGSLLGSWDGTSTFVVGRLTLDGHFSRDKIFAIADRLQIGPQVRTQLAAIHQGTIRLILESTFAIPRQLRIQPTMLSGSKLDFDLDVIPQLLSPPAKRNIYLDGEGRDVKLVISMAS